MSLDSTALHSHIKDWTSGLNLDPIENCNDKVFDNRVYLQLVALLLCNFLSNHIWYSPCRLPCYVCWHTIVELGNQLILDFYCCGHQILTRTAYNLHSIAIHIIQIEMLKFSMKVLVEQSSGDNTKPWNGYRPLSESNLLGLKAPQILCQASRVKKCEIRDGEIWKMGRAEIQNSMFEIPIDNSLVDVRAGRH